MAQVGEAEGPKEGWGEPSGPPPVEAARKPRAGTRVSKTQRAAVRAPRNRSFLRVRKQVTPAGGTGRLGGFPLPRATSSGYTMRPPRPGRPRLPVRPTDPLARAAPPHRLTPSAPTPARRRERAPPHLHSDMTELVTPRRSKRGAARVNVIWLVVLIVAFFVSMGLAFVFSDEASTNLEAMQRAREAEQKARTDFETARDTIRAISEVVGFYDETAASPETDVEALKAALEQAKGSFPDMTPTVNTLQKVLERVPGSYTAKTREAGELARQVEQLRNEIAAKTQALTALQADKDRQIADLQRQLADAERAASERQSELESQLASVRSTLSERESTIVSLRGQIDDLQRQFEKERSFLTTRMKEMGRKLDVFLREPEAPDGKILAVSADLDVGWISLGQSDRVFRGMRFRVVDGTPGVDRVKAWAEVTRVEDDMAEVLLTDKADPFDPPVAGDLIYNPLYDPKGERNAVLVGRFSGTYNEKELAMLLSEIRIRVQPKVDQTTDFLIVGAELYVDEDGEPLEEPLPPSELPEYKNAEALGVQIVPLQEVRRYFHRSIP